MGVPKIPPLQSFQYFYLIPDSSTSNIHHISNLEYRCLYINNLHYMQIYKYVICFLAVTINQYVLYEYEEDVVCITFEQIKSLAIENMEQETEFLLGCFLILKASSLSSHNLSAISRIAFGSNGQNTKDY